MARCARASPGAASPREELGSPPASSAASPAPMAPCTGAAGASCGVTLSGSRPSRRTSTRFGSATGSTTPTGSQCRTSRRRASSAGRKPSRGCSRRHPAPSGGKPPEGPWPVSTGQYFKKEKRLVPLIFLTIVNIFKLTISEFKGHV